MQTNEPCLCESQARCHGNLTDTEVMMNRMDPRISVQRYHEIMNLFEDAYVQVQKEKRR